MRIGSINQISQLYQSSSTKKKNGISDTNQKDQLSISEFGKDYQTAKNALKDVQNVRKDKVETVKNSIESGNYDVSPTNFVDHLLAAYQNRTL